ncbi:MAG TPA: hypothetical protein VME46_09540 [Acidimicrobiales bacterium]|nr:hypothetical protein [Acidimicrobiales bacterium]
MTYPRRLSWRPVPRAAGRLAGTCTLLMALALVVGTGTAAAASTAHRHFTAASAKTMIVTDWKAFFSSKTPVPEKVKLVQDGPEFAKVIAAQSKMPMAQGVAATVSNVTLNKSLTQAKVTYTVTIQGQAALKNEPGTAILQDGVWKVGAQSFCALLALEGSAGQVAVCKAK